MIKYLLQCMAMLLLIFTICPVKAVKVTNISVDRVYTAPSITFNNISKNYGDTAFSVSPSSNSGGSFSYSSDNTAVATVSGNTVTIVGAGTAHITATQAASGNYSGGTAIATLTVNTIAPTISAISNLSVLTSQVNLVCIGTADACKRGVRLRIIVRTLTDANRKAVAAALGAGASVRVNASSDLVPVRIRDGEEVLFLVHDHTKAEESIALRTGQRALVTTFSEQFEKAWRSAKPVKL